MNTRFGTTFPHWSDLQQMKPHERHEAWLLAREAGIRIEGGLKSVDKQKHEFPYDADHNRDPVKKKNGAVSGTTQT